MLGLFSDSHETNDPGPQFIKHRIETPSNVVRGRSSPHRTGHRGRCLRIQNCNQFIGLLYRRKNVRENKNLSIRKKIKTVLLMLLFILESKIYKEHRSSSPNLVKSIRFYCLIIFK